MSVPTVVSGLSVPELQAAYEAARRGDFAPARLGRVTGAGRTDAPDTTARYGRGAPAGTLPSSGAATARLRRTAHPQERSAAVAPVGPIGAMINDWATRDLVVVVLAAHAGAGASTVAVAVAVALAAAGTPTRLVDVGDPAASGLLAACDAELGVDDRGWRRGRRGPLPIDRLAERSATTPQVMPPCPGEPGANECLVVDVGSPAGPVLAEGGWIQQLLSMATPVLVCRPTVPAVRHTENLIRALPQGRPVLIAAPGPRRWSGAVTASAGPLISAARTAGRVVTVPMERRLQVHGVTAEPLPKALTAAGAVLAAHLINDQPAARRAG